MSRPFSPRPSPFAGSFVRVNGKIRAREVRVVAQDNKQLGVFQLGEAINMARAQGVDLVEIAPNATPPVCRLVDYGKFRYEQAKKEKEARKHHHANKVKEVQLSATIDPHDFSVKLSHAIDFLCDESDQPIADAVEVFIDVAVIDTKDTKSLRVQVICTLRVICQFLFGAVRRAVNLNDDPALPTNEIDKIWSDRTLPDKFQAIEPTIA